ncbi:MAG: LysR family transcriptional regulator [Acinetobacter sp.]
MDMKVLMNLLKTAQMGSLTSAAEDACLTIQALAAQLKKAEAYFGIKIFDRTNKGVTLTEEGKQLMPYIRDVVQSAESLQFKARQLKKNMTDPIRVALNSTFSADTNKKIIDFLIERLGSDKIIFSTSESPENVNKLSKDEIDMAVIIGNHVPSGYYRLRLTGLHITVVAACASQNHHTVRTLIQPLSECPYSTSFDKFFSSDQRRSKDINILCSGSEFITVSLLKSDHRIGMMSKDVARANNLFIVPDFEDVLEVYLIMKQPMLTEQDLVSFSSQTLCLPHIPLIA